MTRMIWIGARSASGLRLVIDPLAPRSELYSIIDRACHVHPCRVLDFRLAVYNEAMLEWSCTGLTRRGRA